MLLSDLNHILDVLAPFELAESWDNAGLQVGDPAASVQRVLVALDLTPAVFEEAVLQACDTIVIHHPFLFAPLHSLSEARPREQLLRRCVAKGINVIACHTNLDSARGGIGDTVAAVLGLQELEPLVPAPAGWAKLVGFIPPDAVEEVAGAVFEAGAGVIGDYTECAFALEGEGWFTPGAAAQPTMGHLGLSERVAEVRWETVVPRHRIGAVIRAFVGAHPYEEPAFDIYPVEDVLPRVGLGRVGRLDQPVTVEEFAQVVAASLELSSVLYSGSGMRMIQRVAVVPGSGVSLLPEARGRADAFVTGDVSYHDADKAEEAGLALIVAPHGELEWLGLRCWVPRLAEHLATSEVTLIVSTEWRSPWTSSGARWPSGEVSLASDVETAASSNRPGTATEGAVAQIPPIRTAILRVDGGSRGNPGPSAIGVVLEHPDGAVVTKIGRCIGNTTNNVAEYRALLTGLELALDHGVEELMVFSDSELLVKQINGQYRVKNEGLRPLFEEAVARLGEFGEVRVRHVGREKNAEADRLVNQALDEA